jgi:uncharacterized protein (DUF433 family)
MSVTEALTLPLPLLRTDAGGTIRVGGTRVRLDTVVTAYKQGRTAEEIQDSYDALTLEQIQATISYYLEHREAVEAYLAERETVAAQVRQENKRRWTSEGLREKLLARHAVRGGDG